VVADTLRIDRMLCLSVMRLIGTWEDSIMKRLDERYVWAVRLSSLADFYMAQFSGEKDGRLNESVV
jgi:hypothetical protein